MRYKRAHCCNKIANRAHVRLMTKLKNQSELTQTADAGGENGGGSGSVVGTVICDPLELARSW